MVFDDQYATPDKTLDEFAGAALTHGPVLAPAGGVNWASGVAMVNVQ